MIQSNPPRAEARRQARVAAREEQPGLDELAVYGLPNRAQRRATPAEPGTGVNPHSNTDGASTRRRNLKRRAARIRARRRAERTLT